jgi:hypothetical protein
MLQWIVMEFWIGDRQRHAVEVPMERDRAALGDPSPNGLNQRTRVRRLAHASAHEQNLQI